MLLTKRFIFSCVLLTTAFLLTSCGDSGRDKLEQARVKSIIINSRAFATDNDGYYPEELSDLHPKYIDLVNNLYSPPHSNNEIDAQAYYFRSGIRVGSKIDEPIVVSPHVVKGYVNVGYVGGFMRRLKYEEAQEILGSQGWTQKAPPLKGGLTSR